MRAHTTHAGARLWEAPGTEQPGGEASHLAVLVRVRAAQVPEGLACVDRALRRWFSQARCPQPPAVCPRPAGRTARALHSAFLLLPVMPDPSRAVHSLPTGSPPGVALVQPLGPGGLTLRTEGRGRVPGEGNGARPGGEGSSPSVTPQHRHRRAVSFSLMQVLGRKAGSTALCFCFLFELVMIWFSFIIWTSWSSTRLLMVVCFSW